MKFLSARNALLELVGSRLATHFGILVPEPAAVLVENDFANLLNETLRPRQVSAGLKFGSRVVGAMATWLVDRTIPDAMFRDATNIFAFDALIQNTDRRRNNPNLFTQGDEIFVYDHEETSFSFLMAVPASAQPWNLEREEYLSNHVFYKRIRARPIDLGDFGERLERLTDEALARIKEEIPAEWAHEDLARIEAHLASVRNHRAEFLEQVARRLL